MSKYSMTCPHCNRTYVVVCSENESKICCSHCSTVVKVRIEQNAQVENRKIDAAVYKDKLAYDLECKKIDNDFIIGVFQYIGVVVVIASIFILIGIKI